MRVVIQRVTHASVDIDKQTVASINKGLLVLVGIEDSDTNEDIAWLSAKMVNLRVFDDENGVMNLSVKDVGGEVLIVSQFTLHASTKKGNRPSYIKAARPEVAIPIYETFIKQVDSLLGKRVPTGQFGARMQKFIRGFRLSLPTHCPMRGEISSSTSGGSKTISLTLTSLRSTNSHLSGDEEWGLWNISPKQHASEKWRRWT